MESFVQEMDILYGDSFQIDVLTTTPNRYSNYNPSNEFTSFGKKIRIERCLIENQRKGFIYQAYSFIKYFFYVIHFINNSKKFDLVFSTSSKLMTGFLGAIVSHKVKSKFFLDIRDIFSETIEDIFSKKISALLLPMITIIEKYTMSRADRVNLVSRGFESYFSKKYPNNDYCFITNGIDQEFIDFFDEEYFSSKSRMIEPRGLRPLKIFYAGNIGEGQGLDKILPEMATIIKEDAEFTIVGDGSGLAALQKVIFEKNISNIVIHKPVARDELLKFYLSSDILFLHLNNYDAFKKVLPSKIFEYAATGLPILAGVDGYSKEFLQENVENSRIFTPCNAKEAIDEMNMLDFVSINRKEFKENYSRKKTSEMLVSRFIELL